MEFHAGHDLARKHAPALERFLAQLMLDRSRLCLPAVAAAMLVSLLASRPLGVDLHGWAFVTNACVTAVAIAMAVVSRRVQIPERYAHLFGAVTWLLAPIATLVTQAQTGMSWQVMLVMVELAGAGILVSTRWMVGCTSLVIAAWMPLGIRDGGLLTGFQISVVFGGGVLAYYVHLAMRSSVVRAELLRLEERETSEALGRELAERQQAELEREQIREQFIHAQRLEAVGTLAAGLAHDMNNILAGVLGVADLLREDQDDPRVREDCEAIIAEAQRGASLTRSLLAFSRRGQYRRRPVALAEVIDPLGTLLAHTLPKTVTVVREGPTSAVLDADPAQLGQVIVNLCLNASDAMNGTGTLTISTDQRTLADGDADRLKLPRGRAWAVLAVTDTGTGMDETTRRRLFEPFFTTKPVGKGTGLGLAMVYGAVQGHDGAIEVESAPGRGSTFRLYLPISHGVPTEKPARDHGGQVLPRRVVLVVDDEPMVRRTATRILEGLGVTAITSEDGAEALRIYDGRKAEVALVLLDMSMPVMGGAECFRALRARSSVPVLVMSGYAIDREVQSLIAEGAAGFIEKPYTIAELSRQVVRILGA